MWSMIRWNDRIEVKIMSYLNFLLTFLVGEEGGTYALKKIKLWMSLSLQNFEEDQNLFRFLFIFLLQFSVLFWSVARFSRGPRLVSLEKMRNIVFESAINVWLIWYLYTMIPPPSMATSSVHKTRSTVQQEFCSVKLL